MLHGFYRIKSLLHNKMTIFWSMAFPIFLGALFFFFIFGGFDDLLKFKEVPVGIINSGGNKEFLEILETVEAEDGVSMFHVIQYEKEDEAKNALQKENIYGYIDVERNFTLIVKKSCIQNSLIKTFLDQYKQNTALIEQVATSHPERLEAVLDTLFSNEALGIKEVRLKGQDQRVETQYFYALIAMTALIMTIMGMYIGVDIQADLSSIGARRNIAPMSKMKMVFIDFFATYLVCCVMCLIVVAVCILVYKQDFGRNIGLVVLTACAGSFTGMTVGILIASYIKGTLQKKEAFCTTFFMVSSFLGGLQVATIPYILEKKCPIINRLNPATLIVNAFRSLVVFDDYKQYAVNLVTLLVIGFICLFASIMKLRREKYAYI